MKSAFTCSILTALMIFYRQLQLSLLAKRLTYLLKTVFGSNVIREDTALGRAVVTASLCHHVTVVCRSYAHQQLCTPVY